MKLTKQQIKTIQEEIKNIKTDSCFFDSANGTYQGIYVQELARNLGKKGRVIKQSNEFFNEYWIEAEEYINNFIADGFYFGQNDNGDTGIWDLRQCSNCELEIYNDPIIDGKYKFCSNECKNEFNFILSL